MTVSSPKDFLRESQHLTGFDWIWSRYFTQELQPVTQNSVVTMLDIGCGTKPYRQLFHARHYWGIDLPRESVAPDICANALQLPIACDSIDLCFSMWLLDDLVEPSTYFSEIARVLKIRGVAVIVEIQSFPEHDAPHDYWRFTRYGLAYLGRKAGLRTIQIRPLGGFWAGIGIQFTSYFLRGLSGYYPHISRLLAPLANSLFYSLDQVNSMPRGAFAHLAIFEK